MRSIDTVHPGEPDRRALGPIAEHERSTMSAPGTDGHDCTRYPAVRDPEWVAASFGHA
jgi:hypothetical protein